MKSKESDCQTREQAMGADSKTSWPTDRRSQNQTRHCVASALSNGPSRVDVSLLSPEDGNVVFSNYLEFRTANEVHTPSLSSAR
jgi:hypothetical protein